MKIAIIGSRGIPNNYGGFEEFAEYLSISLVSKGHEVWVCNPHYHTYKASDFRGVHIRHIYNPETFMKTSGNFIYDYLCLKFSVKINADIILVLGYTTSSVWFRLVNFRESILVTSLDGLEWKRDKWSPLVKKLTRWFEKLAVRYGGHLISDHPVIKQYFQEQYNAFTTYLPYGADVFSNPDELEIKEYQLQKRGYLLLVARFEAEHNIEMIIEGYLNSGLKELLVLVGNYTTPYGQSLRKKYGDHSNLRFLGGIYNIKKLNNLRYFCSFYFHGHSIGGTNPSLIEAMASGAFIIAHNNPFNRTILEDNAYYFNTRDQIAEILKTKDTDGPDRSKFVENNKQKIKDHYNWNSITGDYEKLFESFLEKRKNRNS